MIVIYTSPGCASCRKVKSWLKDNNLKYIEKNIFQTLLNTEEIKYLLSRVENGSDDIISKRSKIIRDSKVNIDNMKLSELCYFVVNNPSVLKRPIILDNENIQIGYDSEEIDVFKRNELFKLIKCDKSCSHYETCGKLREE